MAGKPAAKEVTDLTQSDDEDIFTVPGKHKVPEEAGEKEP
jgi:hypothetical protein